MASVIDKIKGKLHHGASHTQDQVTLAGKSVGSTGYGMMGLTWRDTPPSEEQSLKAMKAAYDHGSNFWNGGELYGTPERNSLHLLNKYFTLHPEEADKVVISIKGGINPTTHGPDGSKEGVKRTIEECLRVLDGKKSLDLFEYARVDQSTPIEETMGYLDEYIKAGKLGGISLSEVNENTVRRCAKVVKVSAVEVEFSLFSTDILSNGIAKACAELNIPLIAYSPIGRGFLTGNIRKPEDVPQHVLNLDLPRFQGDAFYENVKLADQVADIAKTKGCSSAQVAIAWVKAHSGKPGLPTIIPIPGATTEARIAENTTNVSLTEAEMKSLQDILAKFPVVGNRYNDFFMTLADA